MTPTAKYTSHATAETITAMSNTTTGTGNRWRKLNTLIHLPLWHNPNPMSKQGEAD